MLLCFQEKKTTVIIAIISFGFLFVILKPTTRWPIFVDSDSNLRSVMV